MIVEDYYSVSSYARKKDLISLSPSSKFILYLIKQRGPLKEKQIIKKTLLPKRTVAYALRRLQEKGFIRKFKDKIDKRVSVFESLI